MNEINLNNYWTDMNGNLVHIDNINEIDQLRNSIVLDVATKAKDLRTLMKQVKSVIFDDIASFIDLSLEKYQVKLGGKKGNTTLYTFNGQYKVQYAISEHLQFDERIHAAKVLIDECLREWTQGSRSEIKTLIDRAFNVDKQGNLNTNSVLALRRVEIKDERWLSAMNAISDSVQVIGSKSYIRVYERNKDGSYTQIPLDFAAV